MSIKRETLLVGILCLVATIPAFAESDWLIAQTDKAQYHTGEDMEISGLVLDVIMPQIAIQIYDPDGEILGAYGVELEFDDGFSKTISLDSPFYDKSGLYVIEFEYGQEYDEIFFEVIGTPEEPEPTPPPSLAPEVLMITTDKPTYSDNEFITISGLVSDIGNPTILIGIFDPNDFPAGFYTPPVNSDLEFSVSFLAKSGINFKKTGTYYVKAHYGQSKQTTSFSFVDAPNQPLPPNNDSGNNSLPPSLPPQIVLNPTPPKQEEPTQIPTAKIPKQVEIPNESPKPVIQNIPQTPKPSQESDESTNTLSPQDREIGEILNEITLECDNSHYTDSIVYGEGMGPALMRLCNYKQAVEYFDRSLIKDPNNPEILTNRGAALGKLGKFDAALEHYDLALKIDSKYIPALNNKANVLAETGKPEQAITLYNKILDQDPSYVTAKINSQKAREDLVQYAKMQKTDSVSVNLDDSIPKIESTKINHETQKQQNVMDHIGSFFAGIFGFLK
ncbi:MAG: tetratricopeptide repeat protein [Candidatus Nitrosotenuis sp.]